MGVALLTVSLAASNATAQGPANPPGFERQMRHREVPDDPYLPNVPQVTARSTYVERNGFVSVQVNVDEFGNNILNDAANEPSIAVDPTNPNRIVVGWRQFDSVQSDFRQAGYAYSHDGGQTWTFPGVLEPGVFRSDPVLGSDAEGNFYYYSLCGSRCSTFDTFTCQLFISRDGGITWSEPTPAFGGDKAWMAIDRTGGSGHGNIYAFWTRNNNKSFTRSTDGGMSFDDPVGLPRQPQIGTLVVGLDGTVYVAGQDPGNEEIVVTRSGTAQDPGEPLSFEPASVVPLDGVLGGFQPASPSPGGFLGQAWIVTDDYRNAYVLASVNTPDADPLDVRLSRSEDGALSWSQSVRVNDVRAGWQWFGTMSVAPNGRIDAVWYDTRNDANPNDPAFSEVFYSHSMDGGRTWTASIAISPPFNHSLGYPQQNKIGDYIHMVSDSVGASLAYAATFNGEQDVWFVRLFPDCNGNGIADDEDIANDPSADELPPGGDGVPDECQIDCNGNQIPDGTDLISRTSTDCNGNAIPDDCEIDGADCNGDGVFDDCQAPGPLTGSVLAFDGLSAHVEIPHSALMEFGAGDEITIEAWIRPESAGPTLRAIVTKDEGPVNHFNLRIFNAHLVFRYRNASDTVKYTYRTDEAPVQAGLWTHVTVTHTFATGSIALYVNGEAAPGTWTVGPPDEAPHSLAQALRIGANRKLSTPTQAFDGLIDEVRIWRVIRTPEQIQANMLRDVSAEPGLAAYWRFDEGAGPTATDSAGGHDGELRGARWKPVLTIIGDANNDLVVGMQDLETLLDVFGICDESPAFEPRADFDDNGCVDLDDLTLLLQNFGRTCP